MPKISIIIPLFNRPEFIKETLNSLIAQTYKKWEAIIIDDGSTDNSVQEVDKIAKKDNRIKLYKRNRNPKGAQTCRNIGIEKASGEYLIFLDSDDLLKPFALQQRIETINKYPILDYWIFQTVCFENEIENETKFWNIETEEDNLIRFLNLDSTWHTTAGIWKKEIIKKHIVFDEELACWQDVDFHLQALYQKLKYKIFFNLPADVLYRRHSIGSISQGGFNKIKRKSQIYFVKKYFNLLDNSISKNRFKQLSLNLAELNAKSRYIKNLIIIIFWGVKNKIFSIKQVFQILSKVF